MSVLQFYEKPPGIQPLHDAERMIPWYVSLVSIWNLAEPGYLWYFWLQDRRTIVMESLT